MNYFEFVPQEILNEIIARIEDIETFYDFWEFLQETIEWYQQMEWLNLLVLKYDIDIKIAKKVNLMGLYLGLLKIGGLNFTYEQEWDWDNFDLIKYLTLTQSISLDFNKIIEYDDVDIFLDQYKIANLDPYDIKCFLDY